MVVMIVFVNGFWKPVVMSAMWAEYGTTGFNYYYQYCYYSIENKTRVIYQYTVVGKSLLYFL